MKNEVLVSIICVTYNQEKFIKNAIEGFLSQEVDFGYEILIHDDASTDNTAEIIREYEAMYPRRIRGLYEEENQYSKGMRITKYAIDVSKGKYIALCEGDDYWTDKDKLQMQVDFLEKNPEYSMVAHGALQLNCISGEERVIRCREGDGEVIPRDVIVQPYGNFPTASLMFRREVYLVEETFPYTGIEDWSLQMSSMTLGKMYYIDKTMSVYRYNVKNSWTQKNSVKCLGQFRLNQYLQLIELVDCYDSYMDYKYHEYFANKKNQWLLGVATKYLYCDGYEKMREYCDNICRKSEKYMKYCKRICEICSKLDDKSYCQEEIQRFISKCENLLIYGAGEYAGILADLLESNGIRYDGFIVTHLKESFKYKGKPVWELDKQPFSCKNTGVLLGTSPNLYYEIKDNLERYQMSYYYAPF